MRAFLIALMALTFPLGSLPAGAQTKAAPKAQETPFRPVAVVNDSVITAYDLTQRARLLQLLGARAASPQELQRRAMDALIEDKLKLQAGVRAGIRPTKEIVSEGIAELAEQAKMKPEVLKTQLNKRGVGDQALADFAVASSIWRQVVQARFRRRIEPSPAEIDEEIELAQNRSVTGYRVLELGLAYRGRGEAKTRALAQRLYRQLSAGGNFSAAARRYSASPSRRRGGQVGWVTAESLPPVISEELTKLERGQVTPPIPVSGGMTMLKLLETRTRTGASIDGKDPKIREQVRRKLMSEEINRLADGLLQELRRDAMIEIR